MAFFEALRAIFAEKSDQLDGFKFSVVDNLNIPPSIIYEEFKFVIKCLCGTSRTRKCFCEENSNIKTVVLNRHGDFITFGAIKRLFAQCRPT